MSSERSIDSLRSVSDQIDALVAGGTPNVHNCFFERFDLSIADRIRFVELSQESCRRPTERQTPGIPKVIHRMWLTDAHDPRFPPEAYLKRIGEQIAETSGDFQHAFWSNSQIVLEHVSAQISKQSQASESHVLLMHCDTLKSSPVYSRVGQAIAAKKFVLAGDIFKYLIIATSGGIYADLGVSFTKELLDLILEQDVSLFLCDDIFFQPALMAAPPLMAPFQIFRQLLERPEILAAIYMPDGESFSPGLEIWLHGGIAFSAILMLFYDNSYTILPVPPNRGLLHVESLGSWYKEGSIYGGVTLAEAEVTHLNSVEYLKYKNIIASIEAIGIPDVPAKSAARLKVLACLNGGYALDN